MADVTVWILRGLNLKLINAEWWEVFYGITATSKLNDKKGKAALRVELFLGEDLCLLWLRLNDLSAMTSDFVAYKLSSISPPRPIPDALELERKFGKGKSLALYALINFLRHFSSHSDTNGLLGVSWSLGGKGGIVGVLVWHPCGMGIGITLDTIFMAYEETCLSFLGG